ncbi:hypothetical protein EYF80_010797 [Liparis tanakae]|uniref:Uncharacterized protein n=1 Tax=Liparis tanakae TaxID=230148 RepID=A0A4Z2IN31_9TELE|nr:hypothetical protein EYF80_010797 [Liparis tanakae]
MDMDLDGVVSQVVVQQELPLVPEHALRVVPEAVEAQDIAVVVQELLQSFKENEEPESYLFPVFAVGVVGYTGRVIEAHPELGEKVLCKRVTVGHSERAHSFLEECFKTQSLKEQKDILTDGFLLRMPSGGGPAPQRGTAPPPDSDETTAPVKDDVL